MTHVYALVGPQKGGSKQAYALSDCKAHLVGDVVVFFEEKLGCPIEFDRCDKRVVLPTAHSIIEDAKQNEMKLWKVVTQTSLQIA
jgi:hypothetical protein